MAMIEKATYIKGLCDGMELETASKEGKVIAALLDLVTDMASAIDEMKGKMGDLEDYIEEIDEDLGDVEEVLVGADDELFDETDDDDDDDEDEDEDDGECDGDCANCTMDCGEDDEDEDGEFFEIVCPACGEVINFDSTIDPENLRCPACGEKFECIVDEDDLKKLDGDDEE